MVCLQVECYLQFYFNVRIKPLGEVIGTFGLYLMLPFDPKMAMESLNQRLEEVVG